MDSALAFPGVARPTENFATPQERRRRRRRRHKDDGTFWLWCARN